MVDTAFHANGFIIIDAVPENELQTGKHLEDTILDLINYHKRSHLYCKRHKCLNAQDLISALNEIKEQQRTNGKTPYIHIEGHGSKEALKLLNGSDLKWCTIFEHFREINILSKNNLFFSSGACESGYALKEITLLSKPCPVFGLLAPEQKVKAGDVLDGFTAFYKALILNESLNDALQEFSNKINSKQYALIISQSLFERAAQNYIEQHCMGKGRRTRLERVLSEAKNIPKTSLTLGQTRKLLKKELYGSQAKYLERYFKTFMMIDLYPENAKRFEFDAIAFEHKVKKEKISV